MELILNNIFYTIQGEGPLVGTPSIFIRTAGCNLRCIWCDTKYTWLFSKKTIVDLKNNTPKELHDKIGNEVYNRTKESYKLGIVEILDKIKKYPGKHVVISGGEPLLQKQELINLTDKLLKNEYSVEIETNGTISPNNFNPSIRFNVSPKLKNSYNPKEKRYKVEILRKFLEGDSIFKFVISNKEDIEEIQEIENEIQIPKSRIYLMPESTTKNQLEEKAAWVIQLCKKLRYQYSHRLHIELFGSKRGV